MNNEQEVDLTKPGSNVPYVIAVVVMMFIGVVGSVYLTIFSPYPDNTILIAAIFGFLTPTTLSLLAFMKAQETHLSVNSRLESFIKEAGVAANAQGQIQGRNEANQRTDQLKAEKAEEYEVR